MLEVHLGRSLFRVLRPLRNWSLRSADINVVVGEAMAAVLQDTRDWSRTHSCDSELV